MSVDAILEQIKALTPEEQAELRERLDEQPAATGTALSPELRALLDEREAWCDANPGVGRTLDEVIAAIKGKR